MPHPYTWTKLQNQGPVDITARCGHSMVQTAKGYFLFGGNDGRRNDKGTPAPNADCFQLELVKGGFRWKVVELEPAVVEPPARLTNNLPQRFS